MVDMSSIQTQSMLDRASYQTDLSGLNELRGRAQQNDPEALKAAARQFEGMMFSMMLKSMRAANEVFRSDKMFDTRHVRFYEEMRDQQLATKLGNQGSLGFAKYVEAQVRQLQNSRGRGSSIGEALPLAPESSNRATSLDSVDGRSLLKTPSIDDRNMTINQQSLPMADVPVTQNLVPPHPGSQPSTLVSTVSMPVNSMIEAWPWKNETERATVDGVFNEMERDSEGGIDHKPASVPEQFIQSIKPMAEVVASQTGVNVRALVAQAALETGWGEHVIKNEHGESSHNLFGIKAGSSWQGETVEVETTEYFQGKPLQVVSSFRAYDNYQESLQDYIDLVSNLPRYQSAWENRTDPIEFAQRLQESGYATDPHYAAKIESIITTRDI